MTEQDIQNAIMAELSDEARLFRTNAGTMWQGGYLTPAER